MCDLADEWHFSRRTKNLKQAKTIINKDIGHEKAK